jgi:hypothetical protein
VDWRFVHLSHVFQNAQSFCESLLSLPIDSFLYHLSLYIKNIKEDIDGYLEKVVAVAYGLDMVTQILYDNIPQFEKQVCLQPLYFQIPLYNKPIISSFFSSSSSSFSSSLLSLSSSHCDSTELIQMPWTSQNTCFDLGIPMQNWTIKCLLEQQQLNFYLFNISFFALNKNVKQHTISTCFKLMLTSHSVSWMFSAITIKDVSHSRSSNNKSMSCISNIKSDKIYKQLQSNQANILPRLLQNMHIIASPPDFMSFRFRQINNWFHHINDTKRLVQTNNNNKRKKTFEPGEIQCDNKKLFLLKTK